MKDLPPLRIKGECLIEPDDQILYALAPEMAKALQWISDFCAEHPEWSDQAFDISTSEGEWLENVRAILARLPQKGGEK